MTTLRSIWKPEVYHGQGKTGTFFEGWYFKLIAPGCAARHAVIPGIYMHAEDPSLSHAFIQTLNGLSGRSHFHRYPTAAFRAAADEFDLWIGENHFRLDEVTLAIERPEQTVRGRLRFSGVQPWPVTRFSPGVMGWYAFVPFMQCYHGVLGFDHDIQGELEIDGRAVDLRNGRGYIEKDWGQGFPRAYVWLQTNHFATPGTSLTGSIATIPWRGTWFRGFIVGLRHEGLLYRFATYVGARVEHLSVSRSRVEWVLQGGGRSGPPGAPFDSYRLEISASRGEGAPLAAPEPMGMIERVLESLTASVTVRLTGINSGQPALIFEGQGECAALEVSGSIEEIVG